MLVKCLDYLRSKGLPWQGVKVFGQEINILTSSIARMNLYLNGVEDFSVVCADTLEKPAFTEGNKLRQFDIVLANPPYSIKQWNRESFMNDKWGRNFLGTPPQGRADYAFFQHILASMDDKTGRCAILFPHGVLFRDEEAEIRQKLIQSDVVDCVIGLGPNLFYNSPMEACIIICDKNKPHKCKGNVLFINAINEVIRKNGESMLLQEHIERIVSTYRDRIEVEGFSKLASHNEIAENKYNLNISLYAYSNFFIIDDEIDQDNAVSEWKHCSEELISSYSKLVDLINQ
jgi:type I restriction enzyme M protein